ncbi:conserved hypothetical protein [Cytophaga hutchinsonii ATCC 33406]|uniref:Lipoprotein n=2 Tax=Cytophaga hutchinsonii TaxID=985 RepID=A0A6N4SS30_CYTH3|nr:conserved hypothetical protein [Cytophaga hutchinsonii ATCC 33406]
MTKQRIMDNNTSKRSAFLLVLLAFLLFSGCGVSYNFTGGSVDPNVKTISIQPFFNQSGNGPPSMSLQLTEKFKSFYQDNTKLIVVKENGDWQLEGLITKYFIQPISPQANQTAAQSRLTITINASFKDEKNNREFKKDFSFYADYPSTQTLSQIETEKVNTILDQLVFMVFSETTSNW